MTEPHGHGATTQAEPAHELRIRVVDRSALDVIRRLNTAIFNEQRIINTFDREGLMMLIADLRGDPVGFKVGYQLNQRDFYSAKGGVLAEHRESGVARALLFEMMEHARQRGYEQFVYDTFPNMHPGMTVLGLREGFRVTRADYNTRYEDYRLRLKKEL